MSLPARPGQAVDVLTNDGETLTAGDIEWAMCHLYRQCSFPAKHPPGCPGRHWPSERRRVKMDGMKDVTP